jgi:hypothetical protein
VAKRIAYLYPGPRQPAALAKYLGDLAVLVDTAQRNGMQVVAVKLPTLSQFRSQLPDEAAFEAALTLLLAERGLGLHDFSAELDEPRYYFDTDHLNRAGLTELFQRRLKAVLLEADAKPIHDDRARKVP